MTTRENLAATVVFLLVSLGFVLTVLWLAPSQAAPVPPVEDQPCVQVDSSDGRGLPECEGRAV